MIRWRATVISVGPACLAALGLSLRTDSPSVQVPTNQSSISTSPTREWTHYFETWVTVPPPGRRTTRPVQVPMAPRKRASRSRTEPVTSVGLPSIMYRVRECESGGDYSLTNPHSTASGGWQFLDSTWQYVTGLPGRAKDYSRAVQDRAALKLYRSEGLVPWYASRGCWG